MDTTTSNIDKYWKHMNISIESSKIYNSKIHICWQTLSCSPLLWPSLVEVPNLWNIKCLVNELYFCFIIHLSLAWWAKYVIWCLDLARPLGPFPVGLGACSSVIALVSQTLGSPLMSSSCTSMIFMLGSSFNSFILFCFPASRIIASSLSTNWPGKYFGIRFTNKPKRLTSHD